jgi:hypothetical protein
MLIKKDYSPQGLSFFVRPPSPGRTMENFSLCSLWLCGEILLKLDQAMYK